MSLDDASLSPLVYREEKVTEEHRQSSAFKHMISQWCEPPLTRRTQIEMINQVERLKGGLLTRGGDQVRSGAKPASIAACPKQPQIQTFYIIIML